MSIELREITDDNRAAITALRVGDAQHGFVSTVSDSLAEAVEWAHAKPWYRAVYAGDEPVGFVMISWDVTPQPPDVHGPWFLWKLLIDHRHQRQGFGVATVAAIVRIVRAQGATDLLTSYVVGPGGPIGFYERLGFAPTGEVDGNGEVIMRLPLSA